MPGTVLGTNSTKVHVTLALFSTVWFIMAKVEDSYKYRMASQVLGPRCVEECVGAGGDLPVQQEG